MKDLAFKQRKSIRLKDYDYKTNGYYFVTVVTRERLPLLKQYRSGRGAIAIAQTINDLPKFIDGLAVDYFVVMDDHIHIIFALNDCNRTLGQIVRAMKYNITKLVAAGLQSRPHRGAHSNAPATKGAFGNPDVTSGQVAPATKNNIAGSGKNIWQWNYYEHIIRDEKKLAKIRDYIARNPGIEINDWKAIEN